jgi:hypothetical protein
MLVTSVTMALKPSKMVTRFAQSVITVPREQSYPPDVRRDCIMPKLVRLQSSHVYHVNLDTTALKMMV